MKSVLWNLTSCIGFALGVGFFGCDSLKSEKTTTAIATPTQAGTGDPPADQSVPPTDTRSPVSSPVSVNFDDGTFGALVRSFGPNDNPAAANSNYTIVVKNSEAVFEAPEREAGPALTGFLDLPKDRVPIVGDFSFSWDFPSVTDLTALQSTSGIGVAGLYLRGNIRTDRTTDWQGGMFGDYWAGFMATNAGLISVLRQGNANLMTEPMTANTKVSYRIDKVGSGLALFAKYDDAAWHQVGTNVAIVKNPALPDASFDTYITHVRVLETSGKAISVRADDYSWTFGTK